MFQFIYQIIPCANGFIVILPPKPYNEFAGLKEVIHQRDPLLFPKEEVEAVTRENNIHIFPSLMDALMFLKEKIANV